MRVLIWVQHLLGTGHTVRAVAIARALHAQGASVMVVLGADPPATVDLSGLEIATLTPVAATDGSFRAIESADGVPYQTLAPRRTATLLTLFKTWQPRAILTETFPFGRRAFGAELIPLLEAAQAKGVLRAASIRDVLVRKSPAKEAAMVALARQHYQEVLVHADPQVVTLRESFGRADEIEDLTRYTGFVDAGAPVTHQDERAGVVVSVGGSGVGSALVRCAAKAAAISDPALQWTILLPPQLWAQRETVCGSVGANVSLEPNRADFRALLGAASLSISQAGYNTVLDVLSAGPRMIFVPFAAHEETEQSDRAAALAARALAQVMEEEGLTPAALAAAVAAALQQPLPKIPGFNHAGAAESARVLLRAV